MSINSNTDSYTSKTVETSTHKNVGPVPEQDPMVNRNLDYHENVTNLSDPNESRGLMSSVVEAARSAATRVREAFVGEPTATTTYDDQTRIHADERIKRTDDRDLTFSGSSDSKPTTEKIKDAAYDAKEKIKDTSRDIKDKVKDAAYDIKDRTKDANYDLKDTSKDAHYEMKDKAKDAQYEMKDKAKDAARDIKDKVKDTAYDIKDKTKDAHYEIKDKAKDASRDLQSSSNQTSSLDTHRKKDTLSADSDIAADSNTQRLRDIKEKVKDAAQAPVEMIQTMVAAGRDRMQEARSGDNTNTNTTTTSSTTTTTVKPATEIPGTSDMFSDTYQPAAYQQPATEQAKDKVASTVANAADKAEHWIADNKYKLGEQADKAQDLAADTKHKAQAHESGKEPASDTRYYSGVHGQTY